MKYKVKYIFSNSEESYEDNLYDTEEEAREAGEYGCGCYSLGNEVLNLSNPGDYPLDEDDDVDFEIIEVEE